MAKAIHFGDFGKDSDGSCIVHQDCNLKKILVERHWIRLREELGTKPSVYYIT
jgi:hypothetical protein